jgi:hypothetical protein
MSVTAHVLLLMLYQPVHHLHPLRAPVYVQCQYDMTVFSDERQSPLLIGPYRILALWSHNHKQSRPWPCKPRFCFPLLHCVSLDLRLHAARPTERGMASFVVEKRVMVASHRIAPHGMAGHGMARHDRQDPRPAHTYLEVVVAASAPLLLHTSESSSADDKANGVRELRVQGVQNHAMQGTAIPISYSSAQLPAPWVWVKCQVPSFCIDEVSLWDVVAPVPKRGREEKKKSPLGRPVTCSYLWYLRN